MFTIVIPLYNKGQSVKRSICSVLNQSFSNFEIVIVDDGSTDNSVEVVKSFKDNRIKIVRQANAGVSAARNHGIDIASGQFITFLDADDEYEPNHLETLRKLIDEYPGYNVYATSYKIREAGNEERPKIRNLVFKESHKDGEGVVKSYFHAAASMHMPVHICSLAIRREALGSIRFPVGVKAGEDLYMIARLMTENDMVFSFSYTYIYNFEETNRVMRTHEKVDEYFDNLLKLNCKDKYLRSYIALWHTRRAVYALRFNDTQTILFHLWRSIRIKPLQTKIFKAMLNAMLIRK